MVPLPTTEVTPPPLALPAPALPLPSPDTSLTAILQGNTGVTHESVVPVLPLPVVPVNPGLPAENSGLPPDGVTSVTDASYQALPVYRDVTPPPVTPDIPGRADGVTDVPPEETPAQKVKEDIMSITFKLPTSTVQSLERTVAELNSSLPPGEQLTRHSYAVDILANHDMYRRAAQQQTSYKNALDNEVNKCAALGIRTSQLENELRQEQAKVAQLTAALNQAATATSQSAIPPVIDPVNSPVVPPVSASIASSSPAENDKYDRLYDDYTQLIEQYNRQQKTLLEYQQFFVELNRVILDLCQEAERLSWTRQSYFLWYFQSQIQPFLPS